MNYVGLDTIGVGNHEFDEGKGELLRMQYGNRAHAAAAPNTGTPMRRPAPTGVIRSTAARTARRSTARSSSTWRRT